MKIELSPIPQAYTPKYVFHRNTGFKPPSYNTSAIKSYSIYIYMYPSDLPPKSYLIDHGILCLSSTYGF